ncbi:MAG: CHRD domain-containing protein [Kiloniellales bacterium]|nr:CHRD domain-containing protein [Kiloniellales bacterium]
MSKRRWAAAWLAGPLAAAALICSPVMAALDRASAPLDGFQMMPPMFTPAKGEFVAEIDRDFEVIHYELSYSELRSTIMQAHLRIGQPGVNGGVGVVLCTNLNNAPAGTPVCPKGPYTLSGTIEWFNVIDVPNQGIAEGELSKVIQAIDAGLAYVTVMTSKFPRGEIRGQISLR